MSIVFDVLSWAFILSGSAIIIIGSIGLVRLPDFYSRAHAAGMTDTLGAGLVVLGMMVEAGWTLNLARLAFILIFLFFTSPTASHALAHSALFGGLKPWTRPETDGNPTPDAGAEQ
jgi:multicomponent Na+:H+ antiporter subunit G